MTKMFLRLFLLVNIFSATAFAQDLAASSGGVDFVVDVLGRKGVYFVVGAIFFILTYKNSVKLFAWIENQTLGSRDYILLKLEFLHIEVKENYVTYGLLFLTFGLSVIIFSFFAFKGDFGKATFLGVVAGFVGWKIPKPIINMMVAKRISKFENQMTDALSLLSNGLRAGLSLPQSIGMVVDELPAPVSQEFNIILQQTKIGVPLEEAFDNLAMRVPTQDNDMFVSSVNILRETGGNLAEVFDTICGVIRERVRLKQKIETAVAQGKMQGMMMFSMPFLLGAYFCSTDPQSYHYLFETTMGNLALLLALGLDCLGGFMMWKIIQIKV